MIKLRKELENFIPYNAQEEADRLKMLKLLHSEDNLFSRESFHHFAASVWVVNEKRDRVLLIYHRIYDNWGWVGGHSDGEEDLLKVARKELFEETGIKNACFVPSIHSVEIIPVKEHFRRGERVEAHSHLNVTYLCTVSEDEKLILNSTETGGVRWFDMDDVKKVSDEKWLVDTVYMKIIEKMRESGR